MRLKNIFIIILMFFVLSCIKAKDNYPQTNFKLVKELLDDGFNFKIGKTLNEVKKNLGKPKEIKIEKHIWVEDKTYEAGKFYTLTYDGIIIEIYEINKTKQQLLTKVIITNNKYEIKNGIKIGNSKDFILKLLGKDFEWETKEDFFYRITIEDDLEINEKYKDYLYLKLFFYFKEDKVEMIFFNYDSAYTDGGERVEVK